MTTQLIEDMRAKGYVTPEEAARLAKVPQPTIYAWVRSGALGETLKHGRRRIFVSLEKLRELAGAAMDDEPAEAGATA